MKKKFIYIPLLLLMNVVFTTGCSDFFETNPDDILLGDDYIADINEFYSGYMGVASKVQKLADHMIILSELRGDLLEPTENAPQELWEIYNYTNDSNNEFANPSAYYDAIVNANDYIRKSMEFKAENPNAIPDDVFAPMISGAIRYKAWVYLMLGKLYGEAVYYDDPMVEYNPDHNYPTLQFDELIQQLLTLVDQGVDWDTSTGIQQINGMIPLRFTDILYPDGSGDDTWNMITPNPLALKAELELWAGNYDEVITNTMELLYADGNTKTYKITNDEYNGEWASDIFGERILGYELVDVYMFDYENNQTNRLLEYFSNIPPNNYYLRPTQAAMGRFEAQYQENGIDKTDVYRGENRSYYMNEGDWVFYKLIRAYLSPDKVYKTSTWIPMYRATDIYLFLIEALNQKGLFNEADALFNNGIEDYSLQDPSMFRYPFDNLEVVDAFSKNWGIRGRVNLQPKMPTADSITQPELFKMQFDSLLVEETCLESAGEARSYFAMIRMAKRWNDPSIVADRVSAKYPEGKREAVRQRLMDPENWFIEYDLEADQEQE
ncbi:MAG: hypothetical protein PF436_01885 [Prolixibacteraceae bacterium]|jgi:hypothetical protein|nr:hypothetical protein [Prolixibacteraceae bacterium]